MNVVPCLTFIRRGVAKRNPDRVRLEEEDLKRLIKQHGDDLEDMEMEDDSEEEAEAEVATGGGRKRKKDHGGAKAGGQSTSGEGKRKMDDDDDDEEWESADEEESDDEDVAKKYGLDDYDDEHGGDENAMNMESISTFMNSKDDPYMRDDVDSEAEEMEIMPEDTLIAVSKVHGDHNTLEIYVYEEAEGANMYCHHDQLLPTFPLATEWLDFEPTDDKPGNLLAMGSMQPDIEIWDLDVVDAMEPAYVLAGSSKKKGKKKKKKAGTGHTDAVLTLSWNRNQRQVLASGSADSTVALWDLAQGVVVTSIPHEEKVQSIEWHPVEQQSLLTGCFDKTVKVFDCRNPSDSHKSWLLSAEIEQVMWNIHNPYYFVASTEDGKVAYIDVRAAEPVVTWDAHENSTTGMAFDHKVPGCLATVSSDKSMKVWDLRSETPEMVLKKNLHMGGLHCIASCPDSALLFATGGEREHRVLNLKKNEVVSQRWGLDADQGEDEVEPPTGEEELSDENDIDESMKAEAAAAVAPIKKKKKKKKNKANAPSS